jgi:CubicO group peptidase (beta-lactamase class C family)
MDLAALVSLRPVVACGLAVAALSACRPSGPGRAEAAAGAALAGVASPKDPGLAVLVRKEGRTVFARCAGVADLRTARPIDGRTDFRLASVTKQFTAAAVMLLVRDGKLRYEDSLAALLPGFPEYGRAVTVRHLLNHTSGLPDYEDLMPPVDPSAPVELTQISDEGVLALLEKQAAGRFPPGTRWSYSNSGYVVLGLIVARTSGRPFPDFLRDRIFRPLGMTDTVAHVRGRDEVARRAYGHTKDAAGWRETDQSPTSATLGDGGIYSSLDDLAKWDEALRRHTLLSGDEMRPALEPVTVAGGPPVGPDGAPAAYGFGWFLDPWRGRPRMWHYGETVGFRTAIERLTRDGVTAVVLANRADIDAQALALRAAEPFLGDPGK